MFIRSFSPLQAFQKALRRAHMNSRYGNSWNKYPDPKAQECEAKNWASMETCAEKAKADLDFDEKFELDMI